MKPGFSTSNAYATPRKGGAISLNLKEVFPFEWKMSTNNNEGFFSRFFAIRKRSWLYSRARLTVVTRLKVVRAIT
jgi:hypothetical protein